MTRMKRTTPLSVHHVPQMIIEYRQKVEKIPAKDTAKHVS
jgi:hypothetical protein